MKKIGLSFAMTMLIVLMVPGFITFFFDTNGDYGITEPLAGNAGAKPPEPPFPGYTVESVPVFSPETESRIGFEDYICGVVAAEMPAEYDMEALKAQAVAARTYAYKRLRGESGEAVADLSAADAEAIYQAYLSENELKNIWGSDYDENFSKISEAVKATENQIMIYEDEPIEAVFHSSSSGMTEDAENVWNKEYPYLKGVASAGDEEVSEKRFENEELIELFRNGFPGIILSDGGFLAQFEVISRTDAGYVREARVGSETFTGRQIRELLGLKSAAFTVTEEEGYVVFLTRGYGHGVGMSQSGANFMAQNGYDYKGILEHYYKGASLYELPVG